MHAAPFTSPFWPKFLFRTDGTPPNLERTLLQLRLYGHPGWAHVPPQPGPHLGPARLPPAVWTRDQDFGSPQKPLRLRWGVWPGRKCSCRLHALSARAFSLDNPIAGDHFVSSSGDRGRPSQECFGQRARPRYLNPAHFPKTVKWEAAQLQRQRKGLHYVLLSKHNNQVWYRWVPLMWELRFLFLFKAWGLILEFPIPCQEPRHSMKEKKTNEQFFYK